MSDFLIRFSGAEDAADQIHQVEMELRSEEDETSRIRSGFRSEFGGRERILRNLKKLMDRFNDLGEGAASFQENLEMILRLYRDAEEGILGNLTSSSPKSNPASSERTDAVSSQDEYEGSSIIDRIDASGKNDEKNGLLPGVGMVAAGVLGAGAQASAEGAGQAAGSAAGGDDMSEAAADADGTQPTEACSADLEELTPAVSFPSEEVISGEGDVKLPAASFEEFLALLPEEIRSLLPDACLEYLRELFDAISHFEMPFGDVWFPGIETMIASGIWASFFTFLMWYFYRNNENQEGTETGGTENEDTEEGTAEEEQIEEESTDEDADAAAESADEESASDDATRASDAGEVDKQTDSVAGESESTENANSDASNAETKTDGNSGTEDTGSEEAVSTDSTSGNATSENATTENSATENAVSDPPVSENSAAGDTSASSNNTDNNTMDGSSSQNAEKTEQYNSGINNSGAETAAKAQTAADNALAGDTGVSSGDRSGSGSGRHSGGGSGGGSGSGSGSGTGGYSGLTDSVDLSQGIGDGSAAAEAIPDTGLTEANSLSAGSDPKADYLSSLLGDQGSVTDGLKNWMEAGMENWGRGVAQKLQTTSSSFTSSSPVKTVAKSVVNAAVVDAGMQLAAQGVGVVGSAVGGGKAGLFEELEEEFAV